MSDKHRDLGPVGDGSVPTPDQRDRALSSDATIESRLELAFADALSLARPEPSTAPLLDELNRAIAALTTAVPMASRNPAMAATKRIVHQLTTWYQEQLLSQTRVVDSALLNVLVDLDRRVRDLEIVASNDVLGGRSEVLLAHPDDLPPRAVGHVTAVCTQPDPRRGRVLHAEAGTGITVAALRAAGVDAYGVDAWLAPTGHTNDDVWQVAVLDHLRPMPDASFAAVVLSGLVDSAPVEERLDVLREAARTVTAGGQVLVVTETPESDARRERTGRRDLRSGRPLAAATWSRLLALHGLASEPPVRIADGDHVVDVLVATSHD